MCGPKCALIASKQLYTRVGNEVSFACWGVRGCLESYVISAKDLCSFFIFEVAGAIGSMVPGTPSHAVYITARKSENARYMCGVTKECSFKIGTESSTNLLS